MPDYRLQGVPLLHAQRASLKVNSDLVGQGLRPFDALQEKVQHLTRCCMYVPAQHAPDACAEALMSPHTMLPLQMPGSPKFWRHAACPVLQAAVLPQELISRQASSTKQALSCRNRTSGLLHCSAHVNGGLQPRGYFVTAILEAEGLSNFLRHSCEA